MSTLNNNVEKRIYVKILFSKSSIAALAETYYYRSEMTVPFYSKWSWYFEYRAALLRVKYPKSFIRIDSGPYDYVLPEDKYREKLKNKYLSDKCRLTKIQNKLTDIRRNWNQLFPIEEDPDWNKVQNKISYYQAQLQRSEQEYLSFIK